MRRKLLFAVLLAVLLPLVGFSIFLDRGISGRLTQQVVQEALLAQARGLADDIDRTVNDVWSDLEFFSTLNDVEETLHVYYNELDQQRREDLSDEREIPLIRYGPSIYRDGERQVFAGLGALAVDVDFRDQLAREFSEIVLRKPKFEILVLLDTEARLVACNLRDDRGRPIEQELLEQMFVHDYASNPAVAAALTGEWGAHDQHVSELNLRGASPDSSAHYDVGFAIPILSEQFNGKERVDGVLLALVNWSHFQNHLESPAIKDTFRGLLPDSSKQQPSPYGWIWGADADTILAHPNRDLIGQSLSDDIGLPEMRQDVLDSAEGWGLFRRYAFKGIRKSAAFHRTASVQDGGFDWVVGVGINETEIYARASELRSILFWGTGAVVAVVLLWSLYVSRRMTEPIVELQRFAGRVADGDWDARNDVQTRDEVGLLAVDLNLMAERLGEQRDQLVAVEKDAAWREMARQIAHDIKNPLTPIQLSLDLLERARDERAPEFEDILGRTLVLIRSQVTHLREIADDFHAFTGGRRASPVDVPLAELLDEVLALHESWAIESRVEVSRELAELTVHVDLGKLRRVLVNLITNALQAMPGGGQLMVQLTREDGCAVTRIGDTGAGIAEEARAHLFEPYFTTKSEGTGLGLAISRRSIEEAGGTIALEDALNSTGTVAVVRLPLR